MIEAFERALEATTRSLQGDVGSVFNERRLERTLVEHLKTGAGDGWSAAHAQHSIRPKDFPGVGPVDIALEDPPGTPIALVDTRARVKASLRPLERFPRLGPELSGR